MARRQEGTVYQTADGLWRASIELPARNGKRRRKIVSDMDEREAHRKLKAAIRKRDDNGGDLPTRDMTLAKWLDEWFETIALEKITPKTAQTYIGLINNHIIPSIGKVKLEKLSPADVRMMNRNIVESGRSSTTALQVYRVLSVALKYALREGKVTRNVATLVDAPRKDTPDLKALTLEEGIRVLEVAADEEFGSLWAAVLLTGAREGELLGMERDRVTDELDISWKLQRLSWRHGCSPTCGRKRGFDCPQRWLRKPADKIYRHVWGGLWMSRPKSSAGWRVIPLVEPFASIIQRHLAATADEPNPHNLVWHMPNGDPIDPKRMSVWWHELLARAGVTDVRLHDGRHTTVDLLLEAGVHEDIIMEIVGHSSRVTLRGYKSRGNRKRLTAAMHQLSALLAPATGELRGTREADAS